MRVPEETPKEPVEGARSRRTRHRAVIRRRSAFAAVVALGLIAAGVAAWTTLSGGHTPVSLALTRPAAAEARLPAPARATAPVAARPETHVAVAAIAPASSRDAKADPPPKRRPETGGLRGPGNTPIPILMYHELGATPSHARNPDLYVSTRDFTKQLKYLSDHGYRAVTLQQIYDYWTGNGRLPERPVVLSFDDGSPADYTIAAPLLRSYGWPGVLSLITGHGPATVAARMPTAQVRSMIRDGWEIDSHTVSHVDLRTLGAKELAYELTESRARLHMLFGIPANFLCYPSGKYDARVEEAAAKAGYLAATTTKSGFGHPDGLFSLRRIRVSGGQSLGSFASSLARTP